MRAPKYLGPVAAPPTFPNVAAGQGVSLITWSSEVNRSDAVWGVRFDRDGNRIDTQPLLLTRPLFTTQPHPAFGDNQFLLAWKQLSLGGFCHEELRAKRIPLTVPPSDTEGVSLALNIDAPRVFFNGTQFLTVFNDNDQPEKVVAVRADGMPPTSKAKGDNRVM